MVKVVVGAVILATIGLLIAGVSAVVIVYWPVILVAAVGIVGGLIYLKKQKARTNLV